MSGNEQPQFPLFIFANAPQNREIRFLLMFLRQLGLPDHFGIFIGFALKQPIKPIYRSFQK